ncbi:hypothetical protein LTR66_006884 [Elasticomyces elasticus]|nr:hypothetical protein LTR66_006884 [Elasticomyces elasticus]
MPRKQFLDHLREAAQSLSTNGVQDVQTGGEDGQFAFLSRREPTERPVQIYAMISELSDYPSSHDYIVWTGEDAHPSVGAALQKLRSTSGKTIAQFLSLVSSTLAQRCADDGGDHDMPDSELSGDEDDDEEFDDYFPGDDVDDSRSSAFQLVPNQQIPFGTPTLDGSAVSVPHQLRDRIRADLRAAKTAGFKVGHLGPLLQGGANCFITVSVRIAKLGLSDEAMQAWQVEPSDYLILLLNYPLGYRTNEVIKAYDAFPLRQNIAMRVGISRKYKPTFQQALAAFSYVKEEHSGDSQTSRIAAKDREDLFRNSFISGPLNELLNRRFVTLLKYRDRGMQWHGVEEYYTMRRSGHDSGLHDSVPDHCFEEEELKHQYTRLVMSDHIRDSGNTVDNSFPLLAMQFLLRHFVRCTEFCLVCHKKIGLDVEAIKPYVCDSSLCLYQYMSLGFGPSIEHEIVSQPYVVDLFISFCYASACRGRLRDFPDGLSLNVPASFTRSTGYGNFAYPDKVSPQTEARNNASVRASVVKYRIHMDRAEGEISFDDGEHKTPPLRIGDWVMIRLENAENLEPFAPPPESVFHCRITDVTSFPYIKVGSPIYAVDKNATVIGTDASAANEATNLTNPPPRHAKRPRWIAASLEKHDQNFDNGDPNAGAVLGAREKRDVICRLLELMPTVGEMKRYLDHKRPGDLRDWLDRMLPASLSLLRWIIASNRACIVQVDDPDHPEVKKEDRLYGMEDWIQFRFAMGAPDKEHRFVSAVRATRDRLGLQYPTIFAWHGSALHNWHSIIREGLHFQEVVNGRAFGDGVYHALDTGTSMAYSSDRSGVTFGGNGGASGTWPGSMLKITAVLALSEIINAPGEFQSQRPYLVVKQLDWIQTRYLFIRSAIRRKNKDGMKPKDVYAQDPGLTPRGESGPIIIPASAIKARGNAKITNAATQSSKRFEPSACLDGRGNVTDTGEQDDLGIKEDGASVTTEDEDNAILRSEDVPPNHNSMTRGEKETLTDFVPGLLDHNTLPLINVPPYATSSATQTLTRAFAALRMVQETTPLHELGWFIDPEKFDNAYQWIVQLHSFDSFSETDKPLPLAEQMKKSKIDSVVLEMRFGGDFPMSPPFVRVIRPRFVSFMQGGGGHVTAGGAICMELLTNSGWSSVSTIDSVLLQIRLAIASREPFPAQLDRVQRDYGVSEAAEAYIRACHNHGWRVPDGFREMALSRGSAGPMGVYSTHYMHLTCAHYPPASITLLCPSIFAPERFEQWHPKRWTYLPFNGGPRLCIGQQFALTEIAYSVVRILQRFEHVEWIEEGKTGEIAAPYLPLIEAKTRHKHDCNDSDSLVEEMLSASRIGRVSDIVLSPAGEVRLRFS